MTHQPMAIVLLSTPLARAIPVASNAETSEGLINGSSATLTTRNYFFSRDFSDIVGSNQQSMAQEWAQGFILDFKSGFTTGKFGLGLDAQGLLGIKLDSSPDRVNTGLLPVDGTGGLPTIMAA